jgi:hypothetical protein
MSCGLAAENAFQNDSEPGHFIGGGAGDGEGGATKGAGESRPGDVGGRDGVREPRAGGDQAGTVGAVPLENPKPAAFQLRLPGF